MSTPAPLTGPRPARGAFGPDWAHGLLDFLDVPHLTQPVLAFLAAHPSSRYRAVALSDPRLPAAALAAAADALLADAAAPLPLEPYAREQALEMLAGNPAAPPSALSAINLAGTDRIRAVLAANPATPPLLLAALAGSRDWTVRSCVARHPRTQPAVLVDLAEDEDSAVREAVLGNPACPGPTLHAILGPRPDLPLLRAAARNPRFGPERLSAWLHEHPVASLQRILAIHPNLPPEDLDTLAWLPDTTVQAAVAANPCLPPPLADSLSRPHLPAAVRAALARNPATPVSTAVALLSDPDQDVRSLAARHPDLPADVVAHALAEETSTDVLAALAAHPSCPDPALLRLLEADAEPGVRAGYALPLFNTVEDVIAERPRLSPPLVDALLARPDGYNALPRILAHRDCPLPVLRCHADSPEMRVRAAVAANEHCDMPLVVRLAVDPHPQVRFLACAHPLATEEIRVLSALAY